MSTKRPYHRPRGRRERTAADPAPQAGPPEAALGAEAGARVRLNKFLADCGVASRRKCDELIKSGKVSVDGEPATELGTKVDPAAQQVEINGEILGARRTLPRYYLLNKPVGVVCTNDVREARQRAIDLIDDPDKGRIYTVGRLDEDTTGLVILTSDGDFANRVAHPRYGVQKTYRVRLRGRIDDQSLQAAREGVWLSEGRTAGMRVVVERRSPAVSHLHVTLREGRNREVRRVFAKVGFKVIDLHRERIGPLGDRGLKVGSWRPLTRAEVRDLLDPLPVRGEEQRLKGLRERRSSAAASRAGSGSAGSGRTGSGRTGSRRTGSGRSGSDRPGSDRPGSDRYGSDRYGSNPAGSNRSGSDRAGSNRSDSGRSSSGRSNSGRTGSARAGGAPLRSRARRG